MLQNKIIDIDYCAQKNINNLSVTPVTHSCHTQKVVYVSSDTQKTFVPCVPEVFIFIVYHNISRGKMNNVHNRRPVFLFAQIMLYHKNALYKLVQLQRRII